MDLAERFKTNRPNNMNNDAGAVKAAEKKFDKPELLIISCMDCCVSIHSMFGLQDGEATILSYAGPIIPPYNPEDSSSQILHDNIALAINDMDIKSLVLLGHTKCGAAGKLAANIYNPGDIPCMKKAASQILQTALSIAGEMSNEEMTREVERQIIIQGIKNLFDYPVVINAIKQNRLTVEGLQLEGHSERLLKLNTNGHGFRFDVVAGENLAADESENNTSQKLKAANA